MSSSSLRKTLSATADAYLDAHRTLSPTALASVYSPNAKHSNYPAPVTPIFPSVSNAAYLEGVKDLFTIWTSFEVNEFAPRVVDEDTRRVVLFVEGVGETVSMGTYRNEYVVVLGCDTDGKLIDDRLQFFDSAGLLAWVGKMGEKARELQEKVVGEDQR
ncbi:uncharacterized protein ALTATR162_LOCUS546 [Alternaria atra]|uniref:SnoaL-like domain-containing protein n=1 Tax=Alternaria atra TaxID=119953 RepID=A0A8J2HVG2_9PLEO|nr:uncharacterized protein ALTATR162_LOCUS546 [Alternaria atra]CAG5139699.1 unnamed protein product [Alternaria atra]